jgi:phenylacetate-CoA ligase
LTGGRNPFLPLLRYRTGDYASLQQHQGRAVLVDLEGRTPVVFPLPDDRIVHSMEVTRLLRKFPLVQYQLHQDADGDFKFCYRGGVGQVELQEALRELLGGRRAIVIKKLPPSGASRGKVVVYQSAAAPNLP